MRRKIVIGVAAVVVSAGSLLGVQQVVASAQPADEGLVMFPCDSDVPQARGPVPGPEQWPPVPLGFDRDAPAPPAPLVPGPDGELVPKDQLPAFAPGSPSEGQRVAGPPPGAEREVGTRPCGEAVAELQRAAESENSYWVCYLKDGRYAGEVILDLVDPSQNIPTEVKDSACQDSGYARSTP